MPTLGLRHVYFAENPFRKTLTFFLSPCSLGTSLFKRGVVFPEIGDVYALTSVVRKWIGSKHGNLVKIVPYHPINDYMCITCRCLVKGIIGFQHEVIVFTGSFSLIVIWCNECIH